MALNGNLLNALLSMDAYNRGYGAGIQTDELSDAIGAQLGSVTVSSTSQVLGPNVDSSAGFYALSYDLGGGQTIISYRGTDQAAQIQTTLDLGDLAYLFTFPTQGIGNIVVKLANQTTIDLGPDVWNGWFIGLGADQSAQALLAFEFYKDVVGGHDNVYSANVSLTGHSLGGGLAGLVGTNDNNEQTRKIAA